MVKGEEHNFHVKSGLHVEVKDRSVCDKHPFKAVEELSINGSSAELFNKTSVQCAAVPRGPGVIVYSIFSLMLIDNPILEGKTEFYIIGLLWYIIFMQFAVT